ncbi:hypothetical protein [Sphingobacterium hotanense]|uniref:GLPGLI family protein n=1 Tax=Sphingobacterium hotanense TaxID=649196 RepID=A0ABT7NPW2_9SPHI|nr:hypothetical protein [Sphingobacterium hotanense]MDM1049300.1 hypothetical protein [Sphingobacterium hotanense]
MKFKYFFILFLLCSICTCAIAQQSVSIKVKQDYKLVASVNHSLTLSKSPFKLMFHVKELESFCIAFTSDEDVYRSAIGEADMEVMWFENTGMAEGLFNEDKTIMLSNEAPSYWFYSSLEEHRFDKHPQGTIKEWTAERSIENFYDVVQDETYSVKQINRPIYYVVYVPQYDEDYNQIDKKIYTYGEILWKP